MKMVLMTRENGKKEESRYERGAHDASEGETAKTVS